MIEGKRVVVTMPAYYAEKTVGKTVADLSRDIVDEIILVDDCSKDGTFEAAQKLGITALRGGFPTCEVTCPTVYEEESSSIPFSKAVRYGFQCLKLSGQHLVWRVGRRLSGKGVRPTVGGMPEES